MSAAPIPTRRGVPNPAIPAEVPSSTTTMGPATVGTTTVATTTIGPATVGPATGRAFTGLLNQRSLVPIVSLVSWIYLYLVGMLAAWILVVTLGAGWAPVVLTSGSMSPALRPGDVVMIDDHPTGDGLVGQRSVITFDRGGELITHRVFEVDDNQRAYVTKGDANPTPDTEPVPAESVVGVVRLVIPLLGLPVVWIGENNVPALIAFVVLTLAALVLTFREVRSRNRVAPAMGERNSVMADQAMRRVRILIGVMIISQYVVDASRFAVDRLPIAPFNLLLLALAWLTATNLFSLRSNDHDTGRLHSVIQLVADTVLVIALTTATGGSGIGWVLTALPIVEAAVRFRLVGALMQWMFMALITVFGRVWVLEMGGQPASELMEELGQLIDQLSVLLLVVIPGAFLAEQLLGDVILQRRATDTAVARGRLLEHVAEMGTEVNRMNRRDGTGSTGAGSDLFGLLTRSAIALGFDGADAWIRSIEGKWTRVGAAEPKRALTLPAPGDRASGLRLVDLIHPEVLVDGADDDDEVAALHRAGLDTMVRITLANSGAIVVLRAVTATGTSPDIGQIEALRLLCGQAVVALDNRDKLTDLQNLHDKMEHDATHDALTQLPNRAYFLRELNETLSRSIDDGNRNKVVLFLDLNGFKPVNDTLGHEAGDELLKVVAVRLDEAIGSAGLVARLGGDEFTVLLHDCADRETALDAASAIHQAMAAPIALERDNVVVGASIGIAELVEGIDASEWLRRADTAMYEAKTAAKSGVSSSRVAFYHPDLDVQGQTQGRMVGEFKKALETVIQRSGDQEDFHGLSLAYQPLVSAATGSILGAEVLLRWNHPELGPLGPVVALEMAEQAGLVNELNAWIFHRALGTLSALDIPSSRPFTLAVNVSPAELGSPSTVANLGDAMMLSGVDASRVMVELSERVVASGREIDDAIGRMVALGVGLSLDDFGEGRTSLGHLRGLPIRQLKLDRILVQQACSSASDRIILESVIQLGHNLRFEVVAEGIESDVHIRTATQAGADLLQGYGLYRPMTAEGLTRLMSSALRAESRGLLTAPIGATVDLQGGA